MSPICFLTLTLSRTGSADQALQLNQDIQNSLAGNPLTRQQTGAVRLLAEPRLSYSLSNQVNMDLFLRYSDVRGRSSTVPPITSIDGGVSFRVSFSN